MYKIARINNSGELARAKTFRIGHYLWGSTYRPEVTGRLAYLDGRGFLLQMICRETDPTRVYTNPDDPVCKDSCMEAFWDFMPDAPEPKYVSFEINANGVLHCSFGAGRHGRVFLRQIGIDIPAPKARIGQEFWQIDLTIPLELIHKLYGSLDFKSGYKTRGNFYKCGDETPSEHYGAWSKVFSEKPDFHLSRYFGEMVVE